MAKTWRRGCASASLGAEPSKTTLAPAMPRRHSKGAARQPRAAACTPRRKEAIARHERALYSFGRLRISSAHHDAPPAFIAQEPRVKDTDRDSVARLAGAPRGALDFCSQFQDLGETVGHAALISHTRRSANAITTHPRHSLVPTMSAAIDQDAAISEPLQAAARASTTARKKPVGWKPPPPRRKPPPPKGPPPAAGAGEGAPKTPPPPGAGDAAGAPKPPVSGGR